ncbi:uncharacterized protein PAC_18561 [Phialocephala subalpina]|uniref:Uncharacterized protein n=1 Tax=Phialocephala subalpina TaxID=576137 RepID=A0A1L7XUF9_9HELO|nr:uncharacterized protein PAC_18561 [Phialocephala subalpina]
MTDSATVIALITATDAAEDPSSSPSAFSLEVIGCENSASTGTPTANHLWGLDLPHFNARSKRVQLRKDPTFLTVHCKEAEKLHNLPWRERLPRICQNLLKGIKRYTCLLFYSGDVEEDEEDRGETAELVVSRIQLLRELHDLYREYDLEKKSTARVSDVVILALPLEMEWRELKPQDSKMYADGNGYSIRSLDIKAAGWVLAFEKFRVRSSGGLSPDPETTGHPLYIPSSIVDAMACGVLSACPRLVRRRIETNDPANEKSTAKSEQSAEPSRFILIDKECIVRVKIPLGFLNVPNTIWGGGSDLGLPAIAPERRLGAWLRPWRRTAFNDLIFLITPFLPVDGVPPIRALFNGFCGMQAMSVFNYFEARTTLIMRIEKRCQLLLDSKSVSQLDPDERDLIDVHDKPQSLERDRGGDFYMKTLGSPAAVGYG